jgi:site-specific DNA-methyltransferase (adenine-specific)
MQHSLFQFDESTVAIRAIASDLGASEASVRNWIKTGYLLLGSDKQVTRESYALFKDEVVGSKKLIKRANKQFCSTDTARSARKSARIDLNCPSAIYENSLSEAIKNKEGIFYTPDEISDQFFVDLPSDRSSLTFCDPCCGTGNFLLAAIRNGFSPQNVFGIDTDSAAVEIAKLRLSNCSGFLPSNVTQGDFLQCDGMIGNRPPNFDVIMTNPPWGKKLPKEEREVFGRALGAGKSIDTCSLFFLAAFKQLESGGMCGFLLPDSFFNVASFESARRRVLALEVVSLSDFGKPFAGLLTKAIGIVVRNHSADVPNQTVRCNEAKSGRSHVRRQVHFARNPSAIINFNCTDDEARTIEHIMSIAHSTLKGRARWGLGIVTGNNARYVKKQAAPDHMPVWKGSDIHAQGLKPPTAYIPKDLSVYQQVAPIDVYTAPEKLIYKFISNKLEFFHDKEQRYLLNSANILIPDHEFGFDQIYLADYLNSTVINWMFSAIFGTHKILRGDLERLPLFLAFMESGKPFCDAELQSYLGIQEGENGTFRIA